MKHFVIAILALITIGAVSCKKNISSDAPLPLTRVANLLIPTNGQKLYCLNPATGERRWEFQCSGNMLSNPVVMNDTAFLSTSNGIYAINMFTGKQLWYKFFNNIEHALTSEPGRLYFGTKSAGDSVYCYSTKATRIWAYRETGMNGLTGAPTIAKGCLYFGTSNGRVYCVDKNTGLLAVHATANYFTNPYAAGVNIVGSPQFINNRLFVSADAKLVCLNDSLKRTAVSTTGTPLIWNYNVGGLVTSSPLVYGDMAVVGGEDYNIHCVDATAGVANFRWKYKTGERVRGSAAVDKARENMIMGSNDFNLYAINHITGDLRWKFPTGSMIQNAPIIYEGNVYVTSFDKNIYCINGENGQMIWKYALNNVCKASPMVCTAEGNCIYPSESGMSAN
jgi:outer membrane protein assembly factor BamB